MPKRGFGIIVLISVLVAIVMLIFLTGYNYFVTKPLTFFETAARLKLVKYIPGDKTKLATGNLLYVNTPSKYVVVNKIDGKYYFSQVAKLTGSVNSDFTFSVVTLSGNSLQLKYDKEFSSTCLLREYLNESQNFKDARIELKFDELDDYKKCWDVSEGYKYLREGDLVEIVWQSEQNVLKIDNPVYMLMVSPGN